MMTRKEFSDWVDSFGKGPGEYTEDEQAEIGLRHKDELTKGDKDWSGLADRLYGPGGKTGDALRKWVALRRGPTRDSRKGDDGQETPRSLLQQTEDLYMAKVRYRDERNALNRSLRDQARVDELYDLVKSSAGSLAELKPLKYVPSGEPGDAEAILMLSDWHIGQEASNFYNTYNLGVARNRVMRVVSQAVDYCKTNKVRTLHVLNLGDLIEGIINTNARIEQSTDMVSQLMYASELLAEALAILQSAAPRVTYRFVTDNHSRANQDKHVSIAKENFNRITTWWVKERMKGSGVEFIDDNLDIGLGRFTLNNGLKVAFMHGHEGRKERTLQELVGATQDWTDVVCIGHWHNPAEHVYQNMRLFVNGSLCGTGPYALGCRLFTKPSQKMIISDRGNLLNIDIAAE